MSQTNWIDSQGFSVMLAITLFIHLQKSHCDFFHCKHSAKLSSIQIYSCSDLQYFLLIHSLLLLYRIYLVLLTPPPPQMYCDIIPKIYSVAAYTWFETVNLISSLTTFSRSSNCITGEKYVLTYYFKGSTHERVNDTKTYFWNPPLIPLPHFTHVEGKPQVKCREQPLTRWQRTLTLILIWTGFLILNTQC